MASFSVHFDGPIATEHRVSVRVMAKTYEHMQRAIDRAYLISVYGSVWKHARLTQEQYEETEFIAEWPREGGIILDAIRDGAQGVIDLVATAIAPIFADSMEASIQQADSIVQQIGQRKQYVNKMAGFTPTFESVAAEPPAEWASRYSNRSVVKEIDQLISQITIERYAGSTVAIDLYGSKTYGVFAFDEHRAKQFHLRASLRELGAPMIIDAKIRSLDSGNKFAKPRAKIQNQATGREVSLILEGEADFIILHPHHTATSVKLFVSPIIEAGGFDLQGGDLLFLGLA